MAGPPDPRTGPDGPEPEIVTVTVTVTWSRSRWPTVNNWTRTVLQPEPLAGALSLSAGDPTLNSESAAGPIVAGQPHAAAPGGRGRCPDRRAVRDCCGRGQSLALRQMRSRPVTAIRLRYRYLSGRPPGPERHTTVTALVVIIAQSHHHQ